jgi:chromosome segregation ATPase
MAVEWVVPALAATAGIAGAVGGAITAVTRYKRSTEARLWERLERLEQRDRDRESELDQLRAELVTARASEQHCQRRCAALEGEIADLKRRLEVLTL